MKKPNFVREFDETFSSKFPSRNEKMLNTSQNLNTSILKTSLLGDSVLDSTFRVTDVGYLNNIIQDCKAQVENSEEFVAVSKQYKQITGALARKYEFLLVFLSFWLHCL